MNKIIRITFDYKDDIAQFMRADGTIRTRPFRWTQWNAVVRIIYPHDRSFYYDSYSDFVRDGTYNYVRYGEFKRYES